jgi:tight adherence protein C
MFGLPPHVIAAAAAIALAIPVLAWSLASSRAPTRAVARNLAGRATTDLREAILDRSATERAVMPLVKGLAQRARRLTPGGFVDALERRIVLAGVQHAWPIERVLAAKLLLGAAGVGIGVIRFIDSPSTGRLLFIVVAGFGLYLLPDLLLWSRAKERQETIKRELPDTLDQVTISVEAGLGFEAALSRVARTGAGPLARELVRTLQEMQIGVPRSVALRNLADRTEVSDLRHFIIAILQAESYGVPIAQVLRIQAAELRVKRRQYAEERAMKIPVKVVFPLVLCILPAVFVVLVGPAAIRIARDLFGAL